MTIRQIRPKTNPTNSPAEANSTASQPSRDFVFFLGGLSTYGEVRKVKKRSQMRVTFENGQNAHPSNICLDRLTEDEAMQVQKEFQSIKEKYDHAFQALRARW
jgi:hypothetical protein